MEICVINHRVLRQRLCGGESIGEEERNEIKQLAYTCPYIGGRAVFKARALQAMFQPNAQYNDRVICMPQAQNKGGEANNNNVDIDSLNAIADLQQLGVTNYLEQITKESNEEQNNSSIVRLTQNEIQLYPIPANDYVDISYQSELDGDLILFNSIGEIVLKEKLISKNNTQRIQLTNLKNGIYHYEIVLTNKLKSVGKLTILK